MTAILTGCGIMVFISCCAAYGTLGAFDFYGHSQRAAPWFASPAIDANLVLVGAKAIDFFVW